MSNEPTIKAIETKYAGCRFRSRLEARWAVVLDARGLKWEYEPEGFETLYGRYLPDFRVVVIPDTLTCWLEIKPDNYAVTEDDMGRWISVARGTETMIIVACGLDEMTIIVTPTYVYPHAGRPGFFNVEDIAVGKSARFEHGESGSN